MAENDCIEVVEMLFDSGADGEKYNEELITPHSLFKGEHELLFEKSKKKSCSFGNSVIVLRDYLKSKGKSCFLSNYGMILRYCYRNSPSFIDLVPFKGCCSRRKVKVYKAE